MKKQLLLPLLTSWLIALGSAQASISMFAAWELNEGSGTTFSQSTLGTGETWNQVTNPNQSLTATASDTLSSAGASWAATGVSAPGSTSYVNFTGAATALELSTNVSGSALQGTGAKTFVAWINPTAVEGSILSYTPTGAAGDDLRFLIDSNGDLRGEISSGFFVYDRPSGNFVNDGWTMVAAIFDGNTNSSSFYIGGTGIVSSTSSNTRTINTAGTASLAADRSVEISIGGDQAARAFTGGIDMVAIYEGAATEAELNGIYTNGLAAIPEPTTFALFGLAGLAAIIDLRRRR